MFHPDKEMREIIFEILSNDGKSISAISRELEGQGYAIHRLILTGYLRALTDLNILKEKDVPPAKVYVPVKGKERDIYEIVSDRARQISSGTEADQLVLYALGKLFRRPVFLDELRRAGIKEQVPGRIASVEERGEAKKLLLRAGIKVPDVSAAYLLDDPSIQPQFEELLVTLTIDMFEVSHLVRETKQMKLSFEQK